MWGGGGQIAHFWGKNSSSIIQYKRERPKNNSLTLRNRHNFPPVAFSSTLPPPTQDVPSQVLWHHGTCLMFIHIINIFFFSIDFSVILLYVSLKYQLFLIVLITRGTPIILITKRTSFCNDRDEEFSYLLARARNWDREHEHYQRKIGIYFDSGYNWKKNFHLS